MKIKTHAMSAGIITLNVLDLFVAGVITGANELNLFDQYRRLCFTQMPTALSKGVPSTIPEK